MRSFVAMSAAILLSACGQDAGIDESAVADCSPTADLGELGLEVRTIKNGYGRAACVGDTLTVHTTGWLYDENEADGRGEKFWSSYDGAGDRFSFVLGSGRVIQGWDLALPGMLVGETRELTIPSELAYGAAGRGTIPGNATLVFEIELFAADGPGDDEDG